MNANTPTTITTVELGKFLLCAIVTIRLEGYVSNASGKETGKESTGSIAWNWALNGRPEKYREVIVTQEERIEAKKVYDWLGSLDPNEYMNNEYMRRLAFIGQSKEVSQKETGFASSAINTVKKESAPTLTANGSKGFIGEVGKKINCLVTYLGCNSFDSRFGLCHKHRFVGLNGELISWITSKTQEELKFMQGDRYAVGAIVKEHSTFKGIQETLIKNANVVRA